jgi:hypothetical protein
MQTFMLLLSLVAAFKADTQQKVNPVEKVTSLLEKLQGEIEADGKAEAASYDKFACFCKEQADNKQYAIEKFIEQETSLTATIADKTAKKAQLDSEIAKHGQEITKLNKEQDDAQDARDGEHAVYVEKAADLATAVERMGGAIDQLSGSKGQMADAKVSLMSKHSELIRDSLTLAESLRVPKEHYSMLQGDPHGYSYHSNEIVATFQKLLKDFKTKKVETDQEEQATRQAFEMESGARRNLIKAEEKSKSEKSEMSAQLESDLNAHKTELQQTQDAHQADQNFLNDLTNQCETKAHDWDQRSGKRTAELTAISEALELLKGDVSKMYSSNDLGLLSVKKTTPSKVMLTQEPEQVPMQQGDADAAEEEMDEEEPISFLQLRKPNNAARRQVVGFLTEKANALKSVALSTLLMKLRDAPSPFAKVKQMIQDLVTRLQDEASSESSQKEWCDDNMAETTSERNAAQTNVESYNALITEKTALSAQLTEQINTLSQEIADLQKALNEKTELREEDKLENQQTVADATAGQAAVANALDILNAFYNPGSFVQLKQAPAAEGYERFSAANAGSDGKTVGDMAPEHVSGEYGGKADESKSILVLMEQIKEDFTSTISSTNTDESTAESEYQTFKGETEGSISSKSSLSDTKTDERTASNQAKDQAEADLKREQGLLQAALDELQKLKPVCVDSGMSWEERSARRDQEIDALKQGLKILQNTEFGF